MYDLGLEHMFRTHVLKISAEFGGPAIPRLAFQNDPFKQAHSSITAILLAIDCHILP